MRIVGCGQLGKLVSSTFLKVAAPPRKIPVILDVSDGEPDVYGKPQPWYKVRVDLSSPLAALPQGKLDLSNCRGRGYSVGAALRDLLGVAKFREIDVSGLTVDSFEISNVYDARTAYPFVPLEIETNAEKQRKEDEGAKGRMEETFFSDPEALGLLENL